MASPPATASQSVRVQAGSGEPRGWGTGGLGDRPEPLCLAPALVSWSCEWGDAAGSGVGILAEPLAGSREHGQPVRNCSCRTDEKKMSKGFASQTYLAVPSRLPSQEISPMPPLCSGCPPGAPCQPQTLTESLPRTITLSLSVPGAPLRASHPPCLAQWPAPSTSFTPTAHSQAEGRVRPCPPTSGQAPASQSLAVPGSFL